MAVPMVARKKMKYRTRHLEAGEPFRANNEREARVLTYLKKAERADNPNRNVALDDARERVGMPPLSKDSETIAEVRQEYFDKLGRRPFNGWDIQTLKAKIAEG